MKRHLTFIFLTVGLISCGLTINKNEKVKSGEVKVRWVNKLTGDFTFTKNWDYPEGVYKNNFGQLSCDGLCPPEIDRMKDENGKIYEDSLNVFYQYVDTTHQFHSIESEAWTYEWAGTNFVTAIRKNADTTLCSTHNNIATHSTLILTITKDKCIPIIKVNSVSQSGIKLYSCKDGQIEIDKSLWDKGVLMANFDFSFDHKENPNKPMYWKGKIYTRIDCK